MKMVSLTGMWVPDRPWEEGSEGNSYRKGWFGQGTTLLLVVKSGGPILIQFVSVSRNGHPRLMVRSGNARSRVLAGL
jgi:hypothetical protein